MHVHFQNGPVPDGFSVTPAMVEAACARSGYAAMRPSFGDTNGALATGLADADVLVAITNTLAALPPLPPNRLRAVSLLAAGVDRLAPFDWLPEGAALWNNSGAHGPRAGEYAIMALMMLAARVPAFVADQRARRWVQVATPTLAGRALTVIGTGDLGAAAAERARSFGMNVTGMRRRPEPHSAFARVLGVDALDAVLADTEFLLLACPLTAQTRRMIDARRLALLPQGAGLVNIGRGGLIAQAALCESLHAGHLGGAVIDVTDPEPPPPDDPVWTTPNLILTPHVAADDPRTYIPDSLDILIRNLRALEAGEHPPNTVDLEHGY